MRLLSWLIGLPVAVVAALFAVSNKATTTFALWPLPFTLDAPLYLATLAALAGGFVVGGFIAWANQGGARRRARRLADKVYSLERELKEAQARAATAEKKLTEKTAPVSGEPKSAVMAAPALPSPLPGPAAAAPALPRPALH